MKPEPTPTKTLNLTEIHLKPEYRGKPINQPRFFHFEVSAKAFQEADVIVFEQDGKRFAIKGKL